MIKILEIMVKLKRSYESVREKTFNRGDNVLMWNPSYRYIFKSLKVVRVGPYMITIQFDENSFYIFELDNLNLVGVSTVTISNIIILTFLGLFQSISIFCTIM